MKRSKLNIVLSFFALVYLAAFLIFFLMLLFYLFLDRNEGNIFSVIGGSLAGGLIGFAFFFIPSLLTCYFFIKTIGIYKKSTHEKLCSMVGFLSCLIWSYIFGFEKAENILFHPLSFGVVGAITAFIVAKILNRPEKSDVCR